ncbi:class II D-tagatose-bisphosphate aldolase, non-catalytic subunit (plasmid) [Mesorhizobium sp. ISC25]|uniref:class II D-tagatose-bisphosphate aldolase non-catalytic subunit n=1 Tax=Mesorhizobium sp. ISC25 TaxID=3077335 RepID=UPI0035D92204
MREALYGLDLIASEIVADDGDRSLAGIIERVMLAAPGHWHSHYHGSEASRYLATPPPPLPLAACATCSAASVFPKR